MATAVQHASIAAWSDETLVRENRDRYREKFAAVVPVLDSVLDLQDPDAGFYLWARVPRGDDERFARDLFETAHVTVLPGQYLAREAHGVNPGREYVRMALVADAETCAEGARRIAAFCR
jgi:N-succinyldiaminopimelate aminotransferase